MIRPCIRIIGHLKWPDGRVATTSGFLPIPAELSKQFDRFVRLKSIGAHVYFTPEGTVDHHSRPWSNEASDPVEAKFVPAERGDSRLASNDREYDV